MEIPNDVKARRAWVRPNVQMQSTMTTLTQVGPHMPLALLFQLLSGQCVDDTGHVFNC